MTAERDPQTGIETTGHSWDGIKELNNPLPRWWLWVLWVTVIWAIGYWIAMPTWPTITGFTGGLLGYSQRAVVADELEAAKAVHAPLNARILATPLDRVRTDPELLSFALAGGRSAFLVNCAQCHGTGAAGGKGFPNLNDDDWLWGGTLADIEHAIRFGVRSGHAEAREGDMPAFVKDQLLSEAEAWQIVYYVLDLAVGAPKRDSPAAQLFADNCAACHGADGKGDAKLGAPNLTDAIWLFGGDRNAIYASVAQSRRGVMPGWQSRLDEATIKKLAVYIHALGGGR